MTYNSALPCILTIAGSDSGGGAGVQADLKTIAMTGGYGASVITALTAQNGLGVDAVHAPDPAFVVQQLQSVLAGFAPAAAKTGMLFSADSIRALAPALRSEDFPLVVDPVSVSQSGHALLQDDAVAALKEDILPLAALLTPNRHEASLLTGISIDKQKDVFAAIEALLAMGAKAVLLKGGHFEGDESVDWLGLPGKKPLPLAQPRIDTPNTHGTGCTLSAAIACYLGQGLALEDAVRAAQRFLNLGLRAAFSPGKGVGPVNHSAPLFQARARQDVLESLASAAIALQDMQGAARLVPEVRMNLALALPWPETIEHVAAFSGRITCTRAGRLIPVGCPEFAASSHIAKVVLAAHSINPAVHCAANIRYNESTLKALKAAGLSEAWFDRGGEPHDVKAREGSSLEWGTLQALRAAPTPRDVDAVCDAGEPGKEPMIRLLGKDAPDVVSKMARLLAAME